MPSFDVVSEVDQQELRNAVDQANRELQTRFDFRGVEAKFELEDKNVTSTAPTDFQVKQMLEILRARLSARKIDLRCIEEGEISANISQAKQVLEIKQGIDRELAKKIQNLLKDSKIKVDSQINGEKLRVQGKKRDDLQIAMAHLRGAELPLPLQFENFRD